MSSESCLGKQVHKYISGQDTGNFHEYNYLLIAHMGADKQGYLGSEY